jgi:hypothetical protein
MHGSSLSELRARSLPEQAEALRGHIDEEHARQAHLRARLGLSQAQAERTRRQMWTWDGLSLALCSSWRPFTARDVPADGGLLDIELRDREDGTLALDPWPFSSERLEVHCEARRLEPSYEDEAAMRRGFECAEVLPLAFALVPA